MRRGEPLPRVILLEVRPRVYIERGAKADRPGRAGFDKLSGMAQFPVIGYQLQVSTVPPQQPGAPPIEFIPRVFIEFQTGGQALQLPIKSPTEFMAICALIQAPGRLVFDNTQETLEKIMP
jgi:hypothetical protein